MRDGVENEYLGQDFEELKDYTLELESFIVEISHKVRDVFSRTVDLSKSKRRSFKNSSDSSDEEDIEPRHGLTNRPHEDKLLKALIISRQENASLKEQIANLSIRSDEVAKSLSPNRSRYQGDDRL